MTKPEEIEKISNEWETSQRWKGITRPYTAEDVYRLRGSVDIEHSIATLGSTKLWKLLHTEDYINSLGALTGNQAVQMVQAGLKAIYLSGWQVAADANLAGEMYPDQSLYPANSVPSIVEKINRAFQRADHIQHSQGKNEIDWFAPIVADAEAGFGGNLNAFELMKSMIKSGAAGVHFEDQLSSEKKCGHLGGKVLIPTKQFIKTLISARLAADVSGVPTVLIARTDANSAKLLTSDIDPADHEFITGDRTSEGFFNITGGLNIAIKRGLAYAPYADLLWCETSKPDMAEAKKFAEAIHAKFPGKLLAYNCSPSFNWSQNLSQEDIAKFQSELGKMGYKYQFITLAGFHQLNHGMYDLAKNYRQTGMTAYVDLQNKEFKEDGYTAHKHQSFVGTGYFDDVSQVISGGSTSTNALKDSTEEEQFKEEKPVISEPLKRLDSQ